MSEQSTNRREAVAIVTADPGPANIVARGEDELAERIIRIANENDIPIHEQADVVELLGRVDTGDDIPDVLYTVVAEFIDFASSLEE